MIRGSLFLFSNGSTALMLLALIFSMRRSRRVVLTWAWCLGLAALLLVINALLGVILEIRYMLALWPVFALLVGWDWNGWGRTGCPCSVRFWGFGWRRGCGCP